MSRGGIKEHKREVDLYGLIISYANTKEEADAIKKVVDRYNKDIKEEFKNRDITEFVAGDVRASVTYSPREDFNELQAIEILKKELAKDPSVLQQVVRTKEYIDQDAFETAVYNRQIDAAILAPAITPKAPMVTLRLGKVKK